MEHPDIRHQFNTPPLNTGATYQHGDGRIKESHRIVRTLDHSSQEEQEKKELSLPENVNVKHGASASGYPTQQTEGGEASAENGTNRRPKIFSAQLAVAKNDGQMMDPHPSYHLTISSKEAKNRLKKSENHCYLTHFSEGNDSYVLSVYQRRPYQMKHFKIIFHPHGEGRKYHVEGKESEFDSLENMLHYYEQNPIDPGLMTIGRQVTKEEWEQRWCSIL